MDDWGYNERNKPQLERHKTIMSKKASSKKGFVFRHIVPITLGLVVVGLTIMILSDSQYLSGTFSFR